MNFSGVKEVQGHIYSSFETEMLIPCKILIVIIIIIIIIIITIINNNFTYYEELVAICGIFIFWKNLS